MGFRSFIKLIRLPNLPTALADVFAGFFISLGAHWKQALENSELHLSGYWLFALTLFVSAFLYAGAMANNDVQHADKDRLLKKARPIPEGKISFRNARLLNYLLLISALCIASFISLPIFALSVIIFSASLLYNRLSAGHCIDWSYLPPSPQANFFASLLLTCCRVANASLGVSLGFLLSPQGFSLFQFFTQPFVLILLGTLFVYFLIVMGFSFFEDFGGHRLKLFILGSALAFPHWTGFFILFFILGLQEADTTTLLRTLFPAALCLSLLSGLILFKIIGALKDPTPSKVGMIIKWSIFGETWLLASLIFLKSQTLWPFGILVASLFFLCVLLSPLSHST